MNMATVSGKALTSLTNPMANPYHLWEDLQGPLTRFGPGEIDIRKRLSACDSQIVLAKLTIHFLPKHCFS